MPRCNGEIKRLRLALGLSQNKAAGRADLDRSTYRNAEHGEPVSELTVEKIAMCFSDLSGKPVTAAQLVKE
ncbi:helix-turn-helix domain-containing protein [Roseospira goensis]|uniref:helix-turn-helix domain-containing protein n=1 Tax=Roseospira goensis TaxID=391922 RepID=UPI003CCDD1D9